MKRFHRFWTIALIMVLMGCATPTLQPTPSQSPTKIASIPTQLPRPTLVPILQADRTERPAHYSMTNLAFQPQYAYRSLIQTPIGLTWGPDDRLYIADGAGRDVLVVDQDGTITALNTWRDPNLWQDDGPRCIAFAPDGTLFICNHTHIYRMDADGRAMALTNVSGTPIGSIIFDSSGNLYYTDRGQGILYRWEPSDRNTSATRVSGRSKEIARGIENAENMVFGLDGTLYVAQPIMKKVVQVDVASGKVSDFASFPAMVGDPIFLAVDADGDIWVRELGILFRLGPDGTPKSYIVDGRTYTGGEGFMDAGVYSLGTAAGLAFDPQGGIWVGAFNSAFYYLKRLPAEQGIPAFEFTTVDPGLETSSLAVDSQGRLYLVNEHNQNLWRIDTDGKVDVLAQNLPGGRSAIALDPTGRVFIGFMDAHSILRMEDDGSFSRYASVRVEQMTFGDDGALYAIEREFQQKTTLVRVTGIDQVEPLFTEIDGIPLGGGPGDIFRDPQGGLYVFTEQDLNLFHIDSDGQGRLVANLVALGENPGPTTITAAPNGDIYYIPFSKFILYRLVKEKWGGVRQATGIVGDPWAMVVSPDGKWVYVAESGVIDKIAIDRPGP